MSANKTGPASDPTEDKVTPPPSRRASNPNPQRFALTRPADALSISMTLGWMDGRCGPRVHQLIHCPPLVPHWHPPQPHHYYHHQKNKTGKKTLWVDVHKCFECGKHGHNLPKCRQCSQAYYCDSDCQRKHWRKHKPVCQAAVAALARRATRERLARAVREKGGKQVKGAEEDGLCVICLAKPVDPVEVSG